MGSDSRILLIQERLENDLILGESHFREFKSALEGSERKRRRQVSLVARDIGETLVSFANADGGTLIIGVEDDGSVSGLPYGQDKLEVLENAPNTHVHADTPLPGVRTRLVPIRNETVLVFEVQKGTRYI
ncbi:MAG: ATP-binding protein, partial [Gemmatimonadetes bacterium]|nr:ATP-binding protein [Gemmatimonadota bacterium]